jgi:hypothetical protein
MGMVRTRKRWPNQGPQRRADHRCRKAELRPRDVRDGVRAALERSGFLRACAGMGWVAYFVDGWFGGEESEAPDVTTF